MNSQCLWQHAPNMYNLQSDRVPAETEEGGRATPPLAEEPLASYSCWESQLSLMLCPWWTDHTHRAGPNPRTSWAAQTRLDGERRKKKQPQSWMRKDRRFEKVVRGKVKGHDYIWSTSYKNFQRINKKYKNKTKAREMAQWVKMFSSNPITWVWFLEGETWPASTSPPGRWSSNRVCAPSGI